MTRHPLILLALLGLFAALQPLSAQVDTAPAVTAMQTWLTTIDEGRYADSWSASAPVFQKAISSDKWVEALDNVRKPLGACLERKLGSTAPQSGKHEFVIAQFETSFANMKFAVETVTFEKVGDAWRAAGYYIKPKI